MYVRGGSEYNIHNNTVNIIQIKVCSILWWLPNSDSDSGSGSNLHSSDLKLNLIFETLKLRSINHEMQEKEENQHKNTLMGKESLNLNASNGVTTRLNE